MTKFSDFQKRVDYLATITDEKIKNFLYSRLNDRMFWQLVKDVNK
jgi:hypothetical protein